MEPPLHRDLTKSLFGKRPLKRPKAQPATRPAVAAGLSRGLHQGLHRGLSRGLYQGPDQGVRPVTHDRSSAHETAPPGRAVNPSLIPSQPVQPAAVPLAGPGAMVRKVTLLPGETATHFFCPDKGLVPEVRERGWMLVLTSKRIIAFGQGEGMKETMLMPVEEVKAVAVKAGRRSKGMLFQGALMLTAGVILYVLLAYWLTGRIDGPAIPIIRMDLVAFLVFLAILSGVGVMAQFYFGKPDGEVAFQGDGVKLVFPFRGETAGDQVYQVVDAAFAARQLVRGESRSAGE